MGRCVVALLAVLAASCTGDGDKQHDPRDGGVVDGTVDDAAVPPLDPTWSAFASAPPSTPFDKRHAAVLIEVPDQRRLLLHGGSHFPDGDAGDLWSFSVDTLAWTKLEPTNPPAPRFGHCGAYVPTTNELLIINGGNRRGPLAHEATTLDLETLAWRSVPNPPLGAVGCHAVWDDTRGRVVIFGGADDITTTDHTFVYDPKTRVMTDLAPTIRPPARSSGMMIFDRTTDRVLLFGGSSDPQTVLSDTWAFDGTTWREIATDAPHPSARRSAAHAIDTHGNWLLFGGETETESLDDLWHFDTSVDRWTTITRTGAPSKRAAAASVFVSTLDALVLFGGFYVETLVSLADGHRLVFRQP